MTERLLQSLFLYDCMKSPVNTMLMKLVKYILMFVLVLHVQTGYAQSYDFVPSDLIQIPEEQLNTMTINIRPDIMLFNAKGERLSMDQMSLMANPEFRPIFYADTLGKIKAVVFENKIESPTLIEPNSEANFADGEYALDFLTKDMNGRNIKLSDLRGKVVVLNFWFIKCAPCVMEMPDLNEVASNYDPENVVFLGITFDSQELVEQFLESKTFNYTITPNAYDTISIYGVQSFPTNMVINQQGQIVLKEIGYRTNLKDVLTSAINKLL